MIPRKEALEIIDENISNQNFKKHMIAVGAIMRELAKKFGDEDRWELTGLLHDIDYEKVKGDMDKHGLVSAEMLRGKLSGECLRAIMAHNERTGVKAEKQIDKALIASDAISGLIVSTALVMPNKKLCEVKVESLMKKFKEKSFARGVDRERILVCEEIGLTPREFFDLALKSLQPISEKLGL